MSVGSWPSEQLVDAARAGDAEAIAALVSSSHAQVRRFAHSLCATPEDAEEATQEALIILFRKIGTLRATAALAAWMFQIVRHECMRRTRLLMHRAPARSEVSAEEAALVRLEAERLVTAISALPAEQRAVLVCRDVQGLSGAATARALGLSREAMKSRLHRGREAVRSAVSSPAQPTQ